VDFQGVGSRAKVVPHLHLPDPEHVAGVQDLVAVQDDPGEGVQAVEDQIHRLLVQDLRAGVEGGAVDPVLLADPLEGHLVVPPEGVRDEAVGQEIRVDGPRDGGGKPGGEGVREATGEVGPRGIVGAAELPTLPRSPGPPWRGPGGRRQSGAAGPRPPGVEGGSSPGPPQGVGLGVEHHLGEVQSLRGGEQEVGVLQGLRQEEALHLVPLLFGSDVP
jgi:hypothetical protein